MRRAPYVLVPVCVVMLVTAWLIPSTAYSDIAIAVLFGLFTVAFVFVGGLVAARRPDNTVGWLMLGTGVLMSVGILLAQYAGYALLRDTSLPLGREAAWVTTWIFDPGLCGIILLFLLFPLGRRGRARQDLDCTCLRCRRVARGPEPGGVVRADGRLRRP